MRRPIVSLLIVCGLLLGVVPAYAQGSYTSQFYSLNGISMGTATVTESAAGLSVEIHVAGFDPVAGSHHLAITQAGSCEPPFASAGPDVAALPEIQFYANGSGDYRQTVPVPSGGIADADGSAIVIYADRPGNPGPRIACAVIVAGGAAPPASPPTTPPAPAPAPTTPAPAPAPAPPGRPAPEVTLPEPGSELDTDFPLPEEELDIDRETARVWLETGVAGWFSDAQGRVVGDVIILEPEPSIGVGAILIVDMDPIASNHHTAITSVGQCQGPDFTSAGQEIMVLPEVPFDESGSTYGYFVVEGLDLDTLKDTDRSALVLHAGGDADPGPRIVCAPLQPIPEWLASIGLTVEDVLDELDL